MKKNEFANLMIKIEAYDIKKKAMDPLSIAGVWMLGSQLLGGVIIEMKRSMADINNVLDKIVYDLSDYKSSYGTYDSVKPYVKNIDSAILNISTIKNQMSDILKINTKIESASDAEIIIEKLQNNLELVDRMLSEVFKIKEVLNSLQGVAMSMFHFITQNALASSYTSDIEDLGIQIGFLYPLVEKYKLDINNKINEVKSAMAKAPSASTSTPSPSPSPSIKEDPSKAKEDIDDIDDISNISFSN